MITCTWTLPLSDLRVTDHGYEVLLHSLTPVVSRKLKARLDPDSGYEFAEPMKSLTSPSQPWVPMFTWNGAEPKMDFDGICGLTIRKRD